MCTCIKFNNNKGEMFFGRNLDWVSSFSQKVVITPRNYNYKSAFLGEITPKYAVIGMAVIEENIPLYFDCANEAGLAIAGLNFPELTKYESAPLAGKTNIAAYEFPLYITTNFATVSEVKRALENVAIVAKPVSARFSVSPLHYMISDSEQSIVVEYTENGMEVFHNPVNVLTNVPGFKEQVEKLNLDKLDGVKDLPGDFSSISRFARAAYFNTHYPTKNAETENVLRMFHTLSGVAMIDGVKGMDGGFEKTIYTGGYSVSSKTYYHNSYDDYEIHSVRLAEHDLDGGALVECR